MRKIGIVLFNYPLSPSISIINSAISLANAGYEAHIFIDARSGSLSSEMKFDNERIIVHTLEVPYKKGIERYPPIFRHLENAYRKIMASGSHDAVKSAQSGLANFRFNIMRLNKKFLTFKEELEYYTKHRLDFIYDYFEKINEYIDDTYICIIAVEPLALIASTLIAERHSSGKPIPVIYWNMELLLKSDCNLLNKRITKHLEIECSRKARMTIIQDMSRAECLIGENSIDRDKIAIVPVSGLREKSRARTDYLHRMLGIGQDKKIILYAGNIAEWAMCREIAEAAKSLSDDKVLVMHTWRKDLENDSYGKEILKLIDNKKTYLSLNPVDYERLPAVLSSADIGLVFYRNFGKNFYEVGHSSNKLVEYLNVGLPVIAIDFPSIRDVISKYECGKTAKDSSEIPALADEIFLNYDRYRDNAFRCFDAEYDFSKYFNKVIWEISQLS